MNNKIKFIIVGLLSLLFICYLIFINKDNSKYYQVKNDEEVITQEQKVHTVTFVDRNGDVIQVQVNHGETIGKIPEGNWKEGLFDCWCRKDFGENLREDTPILEDVTYEAKYVEIELLIANGLAIGELELSDVDPNKLRELAERIRNGNTPEEIQEE